MQDRESAMGDAIVVREWDSDEFHRRIIELEGRGYVVRQGTYHILPEMNPETGEIVHLHTIEMLRAAANDSNEEQGQRSLPEQTYRHAAHSGVQSDDL
jgi:hypothetical protein